MAERRNTDDREGDDSYVDRIDTSRPLTADLDVIINSCYIVEAELRHQVDRITQFVNPRTEAERQHTEQLKNGYHEARYAVRTLRRYHEGRKHRAATTGTTAPTTIETNTSPVFGSEHDDPHGARNG